MKHTQRETALGARDLIVIELHGIDGAAAKFVVLGVRPEDGGEQDAGLSLLGVNFHIHGAWLIGGVARGDCGYTLQNYYITKGAGLRDWASVAIQKQNLPQRARRAAQRSRSFLQFTRRLCGGS